MVVCADGLESFASNRAHLPSNSQVTSKPWAQAGLGSGEETGVVVLSSCKTEDVN